jgi:hypothetical protein
MYHIKLFMKQVKLIAALLLFALGASAQTVTPDPGPYTPMNQKYEYRWIKTSGGLWNLGKFVQVDSAQFNGVTYVPSAASNDSTIKAANTGWVRRLFATASGSAGKWDTAGNAGLTDPRLGTTNNSPFAIVTNNIKRLIIPAAGILPATTNAVFLVRDTLNGELKYSTSGGGDTTGLGNLFIRNITTQENKRFNVKGGRLDTLYASTSGGGRIVSNGGTIAAEWGAGGGDNFDFHGFAGYNLNRASSYTTRSFTDKNYVDSSLTLKTTVTSYGKNAGGDSTILLLSNGTRYAAKDSAGGGGWSLTGNASAVTDFLGTTNNRTMRFRTNNIERITIDSATGTTKMLTNSVTPSLIVQNLQPYGTGGSFLQLAQQWLNKDGGQAGYVNANIGKLFMSDNIQAPTLQLSASNFITNNTSGGFYLISPNYEFWDAYGFSGGRQKAKFFASNNGGFVIDGEVDPGIYVINDIPSSKFSVNSVLKGSLPFPRMTTNQRNAIATPATGLQVYNTTTNTNDIYNGAAWSSEPLIVANRQTGNYTLVIGDIGELIELNVGSANTLTVPLNSSVAFPIGSKIDVAQYGAGQTTITPASGVTIRSFGGALKIAGQYGAATLVKIGTNEWYCFGNLSL